MLPKPDFNVALFMGARQGNNPIYAEAAKEVGSGLASLEIGSVYGGGSTGLMGVFASAVTAANGYIEGVMPEALKEFEIAFEQCNEFFWVSDIHERKRILHERSDAYLVLPGGLGTLEELLETVTWAQLGLHSKPIFLLNIEGFFNPLLDFIADIVQHEFADAEDKLLMLPIDQVDTLLDGLNWYKYEGLTSASHDRTSIIQAAINREKQRNNTSSLDDNA